MQTQPSTNWMASTLDHVLSLISPAGHNPAPEHDLIVREIQRHELTPDLISRWQNLVTRSCHANAFLHPDFLLPAWKWLDPDGKSFLMTVEERQSGRLRALGAFEDSPASRSLPLPHLVAAKTIHSFRTGLLLDEAGADQTLEVWLKYLRTQPKWGGVVFPSLRLDSILAQRLQTAAKACQLAWYAGASVTSAALFTPIVSGETLTEHLSSQRRKSLRRNQRSLEALGPVRLRWIDKPNEVGQALKQFLILEDAGWKGAEGTSLKSDFASTQFLRFMAAGFFTRGQLVITQLLAGEQVVATAINLLGASTLFAFKIGWDPQFAKSSPGILHEHLLLPLVCHDFPGVTCVDSCSRPGSYLDELWPHRITVTDAIIPISRLAVSAVAAVDSARSLKHRLLGPKTDRAE